MRIFGINAVKSGSGGTGMLLEIGKRGSSKESRRSKR